VPIPRTADAAAVNIWSASFQPRLCRALRNGTRWMVSPSGPVDVGRTWPVVSVPASVPRNRGTGARKDTSQPV
jgi:hypothetical protein